jgi:hypothetical protein
MDDAKLDRIGDLYQEIGQLVIDMIPEEWRKVYIYSEMEEEGGCNATLKMQHPYRIYN